MFKLLLLTLTLSGGIFVPSIAQAQWLDPVRYCNFMCQYRVIQHTRPHVLTINGDIWGFGPRRVGQSCQTLIGGMFSSRLIRGTIVCVRP